MKVRNYYDQGAIAGEIGIEIEAEGDNIAECRPVGWRTDHDGSLRGHAVEFVLRKPCRRDEVYKKVDLVRTAIQRNAGTVVDSGRAGVHIHVNMQERTLTEVMNFVTGYMIFEDLLTEFCGEHRVGNLFCLRVQDADLLLETIRKAVQNKDFRSIRRNTIRYAAINLESLPKFGSLEFRAMRSTVDPDEIDTWVKLLLCIRDWSLQFDDPRDVIQSFSEVGPDRIFHEVFGGLSAQLMYDENMLYDGVRNAQYIAFCTDDWDFDPYNEFLRAFAKIDPGFQHYQLAKDFSEEARFYGDINTATQLKSLMEKYIERKERDNPVDEQPFRVDDNPFVNMMRMEGLRGQNPLPGAIDLEQPGDEDWEEDL